MVTNGFSWLKISGRLSKPENALKLYGIHERSVEETPLFALPSLYFSLHMNGCSAAPICLILVYIRRFSSH
jgi:hypothetical protein